MRRASIIIPAWNNWSDTRRCLATLRRTAADVEVVVVNNGSKDRTAAGLRRRPWVSVESLPENRGFAAGCNIGAARAAGDILVFLNTDTVPCQPGWLEALLDPFDEADVLATGPVSNGTRPPQLVLSELPRWRRGLRRLDPSVARQARRFLAEVRRNGALDRPAFDVTTLTGFCLAVRRTAFERVGGFDERFAVGSYEDDEICRQLVALGGRLTVVPGAFVFHRGQRTFRANGLDVSEVMADHQQIWRSILEGDSDDGIC